MDDFGRAHAGKPASTEEFRQAVAALPPSPSSRRFSTPGSRKADSPSDPGGGTWSINSFEAEPERAVIVSGTLKEADAQREAAELAPAQIARHWSNVTVPVVADRDATTFDLSARHILLVGRPDSNAIAARLAGRLPIAFGPSSFVLRGETYAHPSSAVIAAGGNPLNPRCEVVVFAGLSAEATRRCVLKIGDRGDDRPAERAPPGLRGQTSTARPVRSIAGRDHRPEPGSSRANPARSLISQRDDWGLSD